MSRAELEVCQRLHALAIQIEEERARCIEAGCDGDQIITSLSGAIELVKHAAEAFK